MAITVEVVELERTDPGGLTGCMAELEARGDGKGWINFGPALSAEELAPVPHKTGLGQWFSGRGPAVPMATWTPGVARGRARPAQVGLAHGTGPDALDRLADVGLSLPAGWVGKQDHAKHGIVAELPDAVDHRSIVDWLIAAMAELSPIIPTGDRWIAEVHRP